MRRMKRAIFVFPFIAALVGAGCGSDNKSEPDAKASVDSNVPVPDAPAPDATPVDVTTALRSKVKTIVVI